MTSAWTFDSLANRVLFGQGQIERASSELAALGARRCLVVASPRMLARIPELIEAMGDQVVGQFTDIVAHCPIETVDAALAAAREVQADGIFTLGGGSAIGVAKNLRVRAGLVSVVAPTTYSGAEMTPIYGAKVGHEKKTSRDPAAKPQTVIYDPNLTLTLGAVETAQTGMNGLAHCIEALYPESADPVSRLLAIQGVEAFFDGLPASCARPSDLSGRSRALYGGFIGGLMVQWVGIRLHHRICHILGGRHDLAHGVSNSVILPYVADYNASPILDAAPELAQRLRGGPGHALRELAMSIGAPTDLRSQGIAFEALPAIAEETLKAPLFNPRPIDGAALLSLLERAWQGDPL